MTITEVFNKYGTDKGNVHNAAHNYGPIYEQIFQDIEVSNLLEVGIENGNSHRAWAEYFPAATIYGADRQLIDIDHSRIKQLLCNQNVIETFFTPAFDALPLMDIIIDDGGHCMNHHAVTLAALWRKVKPGGYYVIEDVHTCNYPINANLFGQPIRNVEGNTLRLFSDYLTAIDKENYVLSSPFVDFSTFKTSEIDFVRIIGDNNTDTVDIFAIKSHGLIIIKKKA